MTLRLTVESDAWQTHVKAVVTQFGDVLPVVKGNGYGFGRSVLMPHAAAISSDVAVGSIYELSEVPSNLRPFVLTPLGSGVTPMARSSEIRPDAVLTVGSERDLRVIGDLGLRNPVVIKVESSMHRYGIPASEADELRKRTESEGHPVVAWSVHLPLAGNDDEHADEAISLVSNLSTDLPLHLSHIGDAIRRVRAATSHRVVVRTGTQLWLGDKSMVSMHTDVIAVRSTMASTAGYRATKVTSRSNVSNADGRLRLIMVGCGSSNGISALENGSSPFHFARQRLDLLEPPHMHTSMLLGASTPCPEPGNWIDVQQPMTRVQPDAIVWR